MTRIVTIPGKKKEVEETFQMIESIPGSVVKPAPTVERVEEILDQLYFRCEYNANKRLIAQVIVEEMT